MFADLSIFSVYDHASWLLVKSQKLAQLKYVILTSFTKLVWSLILELWLFSFLYEGTNAFKAWNKNRPQQKQT